MSSSEHPWYASYPKGVPTEVNVDQYENIIDLLEQSFSKFGNRPAFHNMGTTLSFAEIDRRSKKFASYLQNDLGLKQGSRVALMMPNILQYPVALFGAIRAGMVVVNVNPLYTARELEHQLNDAGAEVIVIFENVAHILEKVIAKTPVKHVLVTQIGDFLKFPKNLLVNFVLKKVKKLVPAWSMENASSFAAAVGSGKESSYQRPTVKADATAFLQYTGGTTGVAKGAELLHRNIVANVVQTGAWLLGGTEEKNHVIITALPLYHIFSLTVNCFIFASKGANNILITNPRDFPGFVAELSKWKFTIITGVNTLFNALLNTRGFSDLDFSQLQLSLGGAMAVQKPVAERWQAVTGVPLLEGYGLTETSPVSTASPLTQKEYSGSIGVPIPNVVLSIKDGDDNNLPMGEPGEICIKGPHVMKGYWNRPEETKKVFSSDGFLKTGDIGIMDERGYFKIVDRKKDMILVSGFNVYPNEIEAIVCEHEKVFECAAIGIPDSKSGELVKIFVVPKDDSLTKEELQAFCRENLTGYKRPRDIEFRKELPKSNVGKILRKDLRPS